VDDRVWLKPPDGHCALEGFRIQCYGRLERHHIINKTKARGNAEVRAILATCPPEVMAWVCEAHNVGRWADSHEAQRILILQKVFEFGYGHMRHFWNALPWKVSGQDTKLEAMLR
jgi:hypothetical protein